VLLSPCTGCGRHLRAAEARCPFCASARPPNAWLVAALLATGACSSSEGASPQRDGAPTATARTSATAPEPTPQAPAYGAPPLAADAGPPQPVDAGDDASSAFAPVDDAGAVPTPGVNDKSGLNDKSGSPPPTTTSTSRRRNDREPPRR
jgi:hypothetical protein